MVGAGEACLRRLVDGLAEELEEDRTTGTVLLATLAPTGCNGSGTLPGGFTEELESGPSAIGSGSRSE
ncbi:hypothetical protein AB1484_20570 [Parafrankia sp. FMc6]|uniref:hypothetical protein n=1 Tax=Parafrankia soli TaxID=2599596 RepID=UPI0034D5AC1C